MRDFELLKNLIQKLSESEHYYLKSALTKNNSSVLTLEHLPSKLYNLLKEFPNLNYQEVEKSIYGSIQKDAFRKLIERLKDRVLDSLIQSECIINNDYYDARAKEIFKLRKQLLVFEMMLLRGMSNYFLSSLDKIISKAVSYEHYDIILIALQKKLIQFRHLKGYSEYVKIKKQISYYEDCQKSSFKAQEYIYFFGSNILSKSQVIDLKKKLPQIINEVREDYNRTKSISIKYYLYYIEYIYYHNNGLYNQKIEILLDLIDFLKIEPFISSFNRLGDAYINLADGYIDLYEFEKSIIALNHVRKYYFKSGYNNSLVEEIISLNYYFCGSFEKASKTISHLSAKIKALQIGSEFMCERLDYYMACILFNNRDFKNSINLLMNLGSLEKDKERWNVAIRILLIQNHVELENFDLADLLIDNLRKHITSKDRNSVISTRDKFITKVLVSLSLQSYNFKSAQRQKKTILENLENSDPKDAGWKIKTPEMIVFHEWFKAKKEHVPYNHEEVMARMKAKYAPVI